MSDPTNMSQQDEKEIIGWLQNKSIPIEHIEAGNGFADLQPLKTVLEGVKIVGLGETTHGTREIFQLKHRLLEFLAIEMGFTTFAIEAGYASCQQINDYVLHGIGDRATVLTAQWYVVWDTEEMAAMIDWMRAYNQMVPESKKVQFCGTDINYNEYGRKAVLEYLRKVDPEQLAITGSFFEALAIEDNKWPGLIDEQAEKNIAELLPQLQDLIDYLISNKDNFVGHSTLAEFNQSLRYVHIMKQWMMTNSSFIRPESVTRSTARSVAMAENLMYLVESAEPDAKFVMSAANSHLSLDGGEPNLGASLREKYGQSYFVFGFEFNQGAFQTRLVLPDKRRGDLKEVTLPPSSPGTRAWYFAQINKDVLILDLRMPVDNPVVEYWLNSPQTVYQAGWAFNESLEYTVDVNMVKAYDGIIFIDITTTSRPNPNALKTVANRNGL